MVAYARLYLIYTLALVRVVRLLVFVFLLFWVVTSIGGNDFPKFALFFLNIFLMLEVFFRKKVARMLPTITVTDATDPNAAMTLQATTLMLSLPSAKFIGRKVTHYPQLRFLLDKAGITVHDLPEQQIEWKDILSKAQEMSRGLQGKYITSMDILAAYLILAEPTAKLLFAKKLKDEDLNAILHWARVEYHAEEIPQKPSIHVSGGGLAEGLLVGWTPETQKYTKNYTLSLRKRPVLIGRDTEYQQLVDALAKSEANNTLIIGDIGVGKENLIQTLAYDSYSGVLPESLRYKVVLELMVGQLIAGATQRSDLEARLQAIIDEISHSGNVILYIPEFQNVMGASSYQIDLSGALLPYLKEGKVPIVASMSQGNYKRYLEQHAIKEVFTVLPLKEPDEKTAMLMLMEKAWEIEKQEKVPLTYKAIAQAVTHADRYMQDAVLPGTAVRLLIDTAHTVSVAKDKKRPRLVLEEDVIAKVEEVTKVKISAPQGQEKEVLLHLEDKLHERVVGQMQAVTVIAEALRRLRTGLQTSHRPISFLFLGPTGVGKTETAKALSDLYYGGENNIIRLDMSEYGDMNGLTRLLGALPGQGEEKGELTDKIHDHPASLVLLDEFEKAHPKILDLFLQVLEDGRLTDNKGRTVSFSNAIIIATSNAGADIIRQAVKSNTPIDKKFQGTVLEYLQANHLFKPELLNRFDDVVTFKPLGPEEVMAITKLYLQSLTTQLAKEDITATFDSAVIEKVAHEGADTEFGARPLRRYIQDTIEDLIAKKKLNDEIKRGSKLAFSVDTTGNIVAQAM